MSDAIDELKIKITAESEKADDKIDDLCNKIEKLASSLGSLNGKKPTGLQDLQKATEGVSKVATDLTSKYKDLGKGFALKGDVTQIQKEIDKLSNAFERANLKKEMLEAADNIGGKMYEYAVRDTQMYGNQIESLKNQLSSISETKISPELELKLANLEQAEKQIKEITEETPRTVEVSADNFGYNRQVIEFVENYSERAKTSVQSLAEKLSELTVPEVRTENLDKLNSSIEKTETKLEELRNKLSNDIVMGRITDSVDDSGYVRLQEQIALTEKRLEAFQNRRIEVENSFSGNALDETKEKLSEISEKGKNATSSLNTLAKSLKKTSIAGKKINGSFSKGLKSILAYGFGIRSVYVLFNKFRSGIKEGMNNLVQYSEETNASMSLLTNSFNQTKNASAAMAAPLLNAVAPALNTIVQWCISGVNALNQLFSALTGKSTWIKAKTLTDDYASSLDKANSSAKKLYNTTLGIDELNINSGDASPGTGYAGTSASDMFETVEVENKFKNLADKIKEYLQPVIDFGEEIKEKIKKIIEDIKIGDWFSTGQDVSNLVVSVTDFFAKAIDDVDWEDIGNKIGDSLAGIEWTDVLSSIGNLIWEAIIASIELWKGSFESAPIETTIATAIALLKFTGIGKTIWTAIKKEIKKTLKNPFAIASIAAAGMGTASFDVLADRIFEKLNEVLETLLPDWAFEFLSKVGAGIVLGAAAGSWFPGAGTVVGAIIGALIEALDAIKIDGKSILKTIVDKIFNFETTKELFDGSKYFFDKAVEDFKKHEWMSIGIDIVSGIIGGFLGAMSFITEPFTDLFEWIWSGIRGIFDMHSPSKKMKPLGEDILLGIVEGFSSMFSEFNKAISDFWETKVKPWFTKEKWYGMLSPIQISFSQAFKGAANNAIGFLNKVLEGVENMVNNAITALVSLADAINVIPGVDVEFSTPNIKLPRIPTFSTGGFPEDGWFRASKGEYFGQFDDGTSYVSNNNQIENGIASGVRQAVREAMSEMYPYLADIAQNTRETADKDMSVNIGDREIYKANIRGSKSYGRLLIT